MNSKEGKIAFGVDHRFWSDDGPERVKVSRRYVQRIRHQIREELDLGRSVFLIGQIIDTHLARTRATFHLRNGRFNTYVLSPPRRNAHFSGDYKLGLRQDNNQLLAKLKLADQKLNFRVLRALVFRQNKLEILADLVPREESIPQA